MGGSMAGKTRKHIEHLLAKLKRINSYIVVSISVYVSVQILFPGSFLGLETGDWATLALFLGWLIVPWWRKRRSTSL